MKEGDLRNDTETGDDRRTPSHLGQISATEKTLDATANPQTTVASASHEALAGFSGPPRIGRYVYLEHLGAGAMGVVVVAYDPKLDRKVAIKLLHSVRRDDTGRRLRMEREAQAMARLAHPNVVTVYEVGEFEDQLFVAMEFVKGQDLRAWLKSHGETRDWRTVLRMFLQAGRGLSAAHTAGIVHRDFKPENVLVGDDGRVRVGDFGLARRVVNERLDGLMSQVRHKARVGETSALEHELTATGAVMGTPAYMAPEQFLGRTTNARSDQFSFCVAAWEALYGQRPFSGEGFAELLVNVTQGTLTPPPKNHVPAWIHRVLERGLAVDPDARYASMAALLAALEADPTRRRWTIAAILGTTAIVGGVFAGQHLQRERTIASCEEEAAAIDSDWNTATRTALERSMLSTGKPYAATTAEKAMQWLDLRAESWRDVSREVCLHHRVDETWDTQLYARASDCLADSRRSLAAFVAATTAAAGQHMARSVQAAAKLPSALQCREPKTLSMRPLAPPELRHQIEAVRTELSHVRAMYWVGEFADGVKLGEATLRRAEALAWPPLVAKARYRLGAIQVEGSDLKGGIENLQDAYFEAAHAADVETAADTAIELARAIGAKQTHYEGGLHWARLAAVELARLGSDGEGLRQSSYLNSLAAVHQVAGQYEDARKLFAQALELKGRITGPQDPNLASGFVNLASVLQDLGNHQDAREYADRAVSMMIQAVGPDHPRTADVITNLADLHFDRGNYKEVIALHKQALAIREASHGRESLPVSASLTNLANAHYHTGDHEEAQRLHERALTIKETQLGREHPSVALTLGNLANIAYDRGDLAQTIALDRRSLEIREKELGPDHPQVGLGLHNLGETLRELGDAAAAQTSYERAVSIFERAHGPTHPKVAYPLTGLAELNLANGEPRAAISPAQRAVEIREQAKSAPEELAYSRFALGRALWESRNDRKRGLELVQQAATALRGRDGEVDTLVKVERWLADREE